MVDGRNVLSKPDFDDIICKLSTPQTVSPDYMPFGDGHSGEKIVKILSSIK